MRSFLAAVLVGVLALAAGLNLHTSDEWEPAEGPIVAVKLEVSEFGFFSS